MDKPAVVFVSCAEEKPENIIKLVIGDSPAYTEENGIECYPWHINTKYYEADIRLCSMKEKTLNQSFASCVHGVVIIFDPESKNALQDVDNWHKYLKEYEAEVKILLCKQCKESSEGVDRIEVQEWCVQNGFELVELEPVLDHEWEEEQDFIETTGIKRVNQALEAHVWPDLIVKERKDPTSMSGLLNRGLNRSADLDNIEQSPEELLENGDFSNLFGQLASLKDKANSMESQDRKQFAEQIVLAYWNAIGGDEEDILDC